MRLWHQSLAPLGQFGRYVDVLQDHLRLVVSEGTEVELHGLSDDAYLGRAPAQLLGSPYARHLIQYRLPEACLEAEQDGYDAFVFASFAEPLLAECRSLVDIPVVSMAEAALHVACTLGGRLALVTPGRRGVPRVRDLVARHGLDTRVSGVYCLDPAMTETELVRDLDATPGVVAEAFRSVARRAVADGADIVLVAEGVLNEIVHAAGISSIDSAVVLDGIGVAFSFAELVVELRRRTGLATPRAWSYPRMDPGLLAGLRANAGLT